MKKSAQISFCGQYRHELRRIWDEGEGLVNFIGLNPSIADAEIDDPTIRRCINFAKSWGYGGIIMTNICGYRSTDPANINQSHLTSSEGRKNWDALARASKDAAIVVCAWGAHKLAQERGEEVRCYLEGHRKIKLHALKLTKDGFPCHPLYLKADLKPQIWEAS